MLAVEEIVGELAVAYDRLEDITLPACGLEVECLPRGVEAERVIDRFDNPAFDCRAVLSAERGDGSLTAR